MIFDAHVHAFNDSFFQALALEAKENNADAPSIKDVAEKIRLELPSTSPKEHAQKWKKEFETHQVDTVACFASHPKEAEAVYEMKQAFPDVFVPLCVINPKAPNVQKRIEQLIEEYGFRGFVLFPSLHHYYLKDQSDFLSYAEAKQLNLIVHCGILNVPLRQHLGLPKTYEIQYANPLDLITVADRYPNLTLQIPHFGAGFLRECMILGKSCSNVYIDTSSSNSWIPTNGTTLAEVFTQALNCFGSERILFGTDSSVFPRGWNKEVYEIQKAILEKCCSPEEQKDIMGQNAQKLYQTKHSG